MEDVTTKAMTIKMFLLALYLTSMAVTASCQGQTPEQMLTEFSKELQTKNVTNISSFLMNVPERIWRLKMVEFRRIHNLPAPAVDQSARAEGAVYASGDNAPEYSQEQLFSKMIPHELFFEQNRSISKIVSIKLHGDEAIARLEFGGYRTEDRLEYAPLIYDALLYRNNGEWKLIDLIPRRDGDERFFEYGFYANPDSKR